MYKRQSLIQKEAESGRELSQLLGELIGCLRALLVAKLDPSADGEGIPAELWNQLVAAAEDYAPDRILAAIDVFAETEGRVKWATNKRLHFELGVIKAIQALGEVRITDVIKVLTRGADYLPQSTPKPQPVETEAAPRPSVPAVVTPAIPTPEPEKPVPAPAKRAPMSNAISALDSLIEAAPEVSEPPPPPELPPWEEPKPKPAAAEPPPEPQPAPDESFYNDPLIQSALEKFEGKVLK